MEKITMEAAEVAEYLGLSKDAVYRLRREGKLPFIRLGERRILFKKDSIDRWLAEQEETSLEDWG
ncbi:MAG TPA: helix-turn-helix domain-containing protein [Bacillales bacterium]|nr:helix-turn-helix domain-containing protein [Bacillales bacterium]